jgi:hypothetical protein
MAGILTEEPTVMLVAMEFIKEVQIATFLIELDVGL